MSGKLIMPNIGAWEKKIAADDPSLDGAEFDERVVEHQPLAQFGESMAAFLKVCSDKHRDWKREPKKWMAFDLGATEFNDMVQHPDCGIQGVVKHIFTAMGRIVDLMYAKHYAEPQTFFIEKLDGNAGWRFHLSPYGKETTTQQIERAMHERKTGKAGPERVTKTNLDTGRIEE